MDLISVVIPIYNTGTYLERCIESILNQTYKNIELILVDDGSDDKETINICKNYELQYSNIKLIRQLNQGSSAARNTGIANAKGKYIAFVDSDDFIDKQMYDTLYKAIKEFNTEIVISNISIENYHRKVIYPDTPSTTGKYSKNQALHYFLLGNWHSSCTTLYSKSLFDNIKFNEGEINEDYFLQYKIIKYLDEISFYQGTFYHYIKRENSNTSVQVNVKHMDWISHTKYILKDIINDETMSSLENEAYYQYLFSNIVLSNKILLNNQKHLTSDLELMYKILNNNLRNEIKNLLINPYLCKNKKIMGIMLGFCPKLYLILVKFILKINNYRKCNK